VRSRDIEPAGVAIDIADNGIGIEQEQFEKIFDPFDQGNPDLARRYGGLGLGLTISRGLVEAHGGRLTGYSEGLGKGSCFTIEFSNAGQKAESASAASPEESMEAS
jgi:signal transduction histidine kinase